MRLFTYIEDGKFTTSSYVIKAYFKEDAINQLEDEIKAPVDPAKVTEISANRGLVRVNCIVKSA